jgi:N-methylhydantoinase B
LRDKLRAERGEIGVFNFGPDIETLRANCLAETGLPAPQAPMWHHELAEAAE